MPLVRRNLPLVPRYLNEREQARPGSPRSSETWQDTERLRRTVHVNRVLSGRRAVSAIEASESAASLLRLAAPQTSVGPVRRRSLDEQIEPHPLLV